MVSDPCRDRPTTSSVSCYCTSQIIPKGRLTTPPGYAPEKIQYGIDRYTNETRRLYRTMDTQLKANPHGYLVGDRVTIADMACWGWVAAAKWAGIDLEEFPALKAWLWKLVERPGFEAGRHVPSPHKALEHYSKTDEELDEQAKGASAWILKGMQEDAAKK